MENESLIGIARKTRLFSPPESPSTLRPDHFPTVPGIQGSFLTNSYQQEGHSVYVKARDIITNDQPKSPTKKTKKGNRPGFSLLVRRDKLDLTRVPESSVELKETPVAKYHFGFQGKHHPVASSRRYLAYGVQENQIRVVDLFTNENKLFEAPCQIKQISISNSDIPLIAILLSNSTLVIGVISRDEHNAEQQNVIVLEKFIIKRPSGLSFTKVMWLPSMSEELITVGSDGSLFIWNFRNTRKDQPAIELDENTQEFSVTKLKENGPVINRIEISSSGNYLLLTSPNSISFWTLSDSGMNQFPVTDLNASVSAAFFVEYVEPNENNTDLSSPPPILIVSDPADSLSLWYPSLNTSSTDLQNIDTITLDASTLPGSLRVDSCLGGAAVILSSPFTSRMHIIRFTRDKYQTNLIDKYKSTRFNSISTFDLSSNILSLDTTVQQVDLPQVSTEGPLSTLSEPLIVFSVVLQYEIKQIKLTLSSIKLKIESTTTKPAGTEHPPKVQDEAEIEPPQNNTTDPITENRDPPEPNREYNMEIPQVSDALHIDAVPPTPPENVKESAYVENKPDDAEPQQENAETEPAKGLLIGTDGPEKEATKQKKSKQKKKKETKPETASQLDKQESKSPVFVSNII